MKTIERQILAALDQLHRQVSGIEPCRWAYDGGRDEYSCAHLTFTGRAVIDHVQQMNHYPITEE